MPVMLQVDLAQLFPQHKWLFPSRAYLASAAGSTTAWRTLFKALGFTDFIQAPLVTLRLTHQQKAASHWADADLGLLSSTGQYTVQDWSADEFRAVVGSLQQHCKDKEALQTHCGHLAHCIDTLWEDEFAGCLSIQSGPQVTGELLGPSALPQGLCMKEMLTCRTFGKSLSLLCQVHMNTSQVLFFKVDCLAARFCSSCC